MQRELSHRSADVILRSSDRQLFYSWKALLSTSSPVFSDMFALPQPDNPSDADAQHDGLPVVDLAEDSSTLDQILSLCHPPSCTGKQFKVDNSIHELRFILEAATKYDMEVLFHMTLKELTNPVFLRQDPVRIYALACQYECQEAARLAAKHTLALPTLLREYVPELEKIHAGKLCRLLLYREACTRVACPLASDHTWIVYTHTSVSLFGCNDDENDEGVGWTTVSMPPSRKYRSGRTENVSVHTWWLEYMRKSGHALERSPHGNAIKGQGLVNDVKTAISSSKCKECNAMQIWETFKSFVDTFAKEVDRRVAGVEIDLGS